MTEPIIYVKRNGITSILGLLARLCRLLQRYYSVILYLSGNDPVIKDALDKMMAACFVLDNAIRPLLPRGD